MVMGLSIIAYSSNMTRYSQLILQGLFSSLPFSLCRKQGRMWKRKCGRSLIKLDTYLELSRFVEPTKTLLMELGKLRKYQIQNFSSVWETLLFPWNAYLEWGFTKMCANNTWASLKILCLLVSSCRNWGHMKNNLTSFQTGAIGQERVMHCFLKRYLWEY